MRLQPFCLCTRMALTSDSLPGTSVGGRAAPPQVRTQAPGFYRMMLGEFEVTALSDGTVDLPFDTLLNGIDSVSLAALLAQAGQSLPVEVSINAYLVNTGSRLVLIDTGAGELFGSRGGGRLPQSLLASGYRPEDIDAVLLTHVHADHSGGLVREERTAFANAIVHVEELDRAYWFSHEAHSQAPEHQRHSFLQGRASLKPYIEAGRLRTFRGAAEILPGFRSIPAPGHTPGHTLFSVENSGQKLVVWGDIVHSAPAQVPCPNVTIRFDSDEAAAAQTRHQVFSDAAREGWLVGAAHVAFPGLGRVRYAERGFSWVPLNYSLKLERPQEPTT